MFESLFSHNSLLLLTTEAAENTEKIASVASVRSVVIYFPIHSAVGIPTIIPIQKLLFISSPQMVFRLSKF